MYYAFEETPGKGVCVAEIVGGLSLLCAGNKSSKLAVSAAYVWACLCATSLPWCVYMCVREKETERDRTGEDESMWLLDPCVSMRKARKVFCACCNVYPSSSFSWFTK